MLEIKYIKSACKSGGVKVQQLNEKKGVQANKLNQSLIFSLVTIIKMFLLKK
jgi:hypothetical protein